MSVESIPKCLACGGPLEPGYIIDSTHGKTEVARWARGQPVEAFFMRGGVKTPKTDLFTTTTYRCVTCGFLMPFARVQIL